MEDPTIAELIRSLMAKVDAIGSSMGQFVTQEQRAADQRVNDLIHQGLRDDLDRVEERDTFRGRLLWSVGIVPVIVGVLVWFLTKGQS